MANRNDSQLSNRLFLATATDSELSEFIERNALEGIVSFNRANIWIRGREYGIALGADICENINTKKNRIRGNWYIRRAM